MPRWSMRLILLTAAPLWVLLAVWHPLLGVAGAAGWAWAWWAHRSGQSEPRQRWGVILTVSVTVGAGLLGMAQLVPYGRDHTNPTIGTEPAWDRPETRDLAVRACYDCHSNETRWPWYTDVAPVSWFVYNHVAEGRAELNFSELGRRQETNEIIETIRDGSMPPWSYTILHPDASLSAAEKDSLIRGFEATLSR